MKTGLSLLVALCVLAGVAQAWPPPAAHTQEAPAPERKLSTQVTELKPGVAIDVTVKQSESYLRAFSIKVPPSAKSLHVVVEDATADIDLILCLGKQPATLDELEEQAEHISSTARFNEVLTLDKDSEPRLKAGTYLIYGGSLQAEVEEEITFRITASLDAAPPRVERKRPPYRVHQPEGLQRAIDASVRLDSEVSTGSATVVTPTGLLLTCYHVLESEGGGYLQKGVYVSFTHDPRRDPVQSHLAETVHVDKSLDLALLRIVSDLDGNEVKRPAFAWAPLGNPGDLMLDDEIRCLGYPGIGGSRSIYGITLSRGIVAGFLERKGQVQFIKTDALISAGNSGGGAFNSKFELIGVPTESMHADETMESLGYLRPVSALPEKWRKLIYDEYPK